MLILCIIKSIWPNSLKGADVINTFKTGDKTLTYFSNYYWQNIWKNIYNRIFNFFNNKYPISVQQYSFKKNTGTTDALPHVTNEMYSNFDNSKPIIWTFLDLMKAF